MRRLVLGGAFAIATSAIAISGPVAAADLGGNCCADLEERIAELEATTARKGNRKVSLTVYGEINNAVMFWDDGTESNAYIVQNSTTESKFGFEGSAAITSDVSAGFRLELELRAAPSDLVSQENDDGFLSGLSIRHANWYLDSKKFGRITVGQQSDAADGIAEIDLSGSTAAAGSAVESWNEFFILRDKNTGAPISTPFAPGEPLMVFLFQGNLDGGRGNFVRYDSPVLAGFIFSASWGEVESEGVSLGEESADDHDWSVALRYAGEFSGFQIAAGISYREGVTVDSDNLVLFDPARTLAGSASVLHVPTGAFFTVAAGNRDYGSNLLGVSYDSTSYYYLKGGLYQRFNPLGKTSLYGEFYSANVDFLKGAAFDVFDETPKMWGLGVVQHVDAAAMELYLSYRHYWANDVTSLLDGLDHDVKFDAVMSGARIKF